MIEVVLFLYLFFPPMKIGIYHILSIFSILYILFNFKKKIPKIIYFNILCIMLLLVYRSIGIFMIDSTSIKSIFLDIISFIEVPLIAWGISVYLLKKEKNIDYLLKKCILVSIFQALIASLCFLSINFQKFILENFIFNKSSPEEIKLLKSISNKRLFGLSSGLLYSMPIYQGVIASIYISKYKKSIKNIIYFLLILLSGILNARIAIVSFLISFFILNFEKLDIKKIIKYLILFLIFICVYLYILQRLDNVSLLWISEFFDEIVNLIKGKKIGTFEHLLSENFWKIPKGIDLFYGTGSDMFGKETPSDVGYVNDLWMGGVFYFVLLWQFFIQNFLYLYCSKINSNFIKIKSLSLIFLFVSVLAHIKGRFYGPSSWWNFIVLICVFNILKERKTQ